jgi:hypothetical protein
MPTIEQPGDAPLHDRERRDDREDADAASLPLGGAAFDIVSARWATAAAAHKHLATKINDARSHEGIARISPPTGQ